MAENPAPRIFGMVTTQHSSEYTHHALQTFFASTELRAQDRFLLIDNDKSFQSNIWMTFSGIERIVNEHPLSFAENVNRVMRESSEYQGDLYFLNNDLIFTPNWITPLVNITDAIVSPLGNQQVQHSSPNFTWRNALELKDYLQHQSEFEVMVSQLPKQNRYLPVIALGFFCVKIPYRVYSAVGPMVISYGKGGGEDTDYCLRSHLKGFPTMFATASYVLHFNQRSTGAIEAPQVKTGREIQYRAEFLKRWGPHLTKIAIDHNLGPISEFGLSEYAKEHNYREIILKLHSLLP
ncbi:MAG: hypothetical protein KDD60_01345 [Bdellovibrionales bacterium]|nr:hypothetical protein [Bdellovibrionales bacterium]